MLGSPVRLEPGTSVSDATRILRHAVEGLRDELHGAQPVVLALLGRDHGVEGAQDRGGDHGEHGDGADGLDEGEAAPGRSPEVLIGRGFHRILQGGTPAAGVT